MYQLLSEDICRALKCLQMHVPSGQKPLIHVRSGQKPLIGQVLATGIANSGNIQALQLIIH